MEARVDETLSRPARPCGRDDRNGWRRTDAIGFPAIIGKDYITARDLLRVQGARPDDLRMAQPNRLCLEAAACRFPEYYTCFADQPAYLFIWHSKGNGFLRVFTSNLPDGSDRLAVTYILRSNTDK